MERKSGFLAYLTALIPGVGYLYLGLKKKGIQALILWILISPVLNLLGLRELDIIKWPLWFYTFFDTINLASRIDKGEFILDSDFLFFSKFNFGGSNKTTSNESQSIKTNGNGLWILGGWTLVILGSLSLLNKLLKGNEIYYIIKNNINIYFIPVVFVLVGVYLLIKNKNSR